MGRILHSALVWFRTQTSATITVKANGEWCVRLHRRRPGVGQKNYMDPVCDMNLANAINRAREAQEAERDPS